MNPCLPPYLLPLILAALCPSLHAAVTITRASQDFTYRYEMDGNPSSQDLDNNGTADWFATTAGGLTIPQIYSGGVAFSNQSAPTPQVLFRTDFNNSLSRNLFTTTNSPFTIETRIRKEGATSGTAGWFSFALQPVGSSQSLRLNIEDNQFSFNSTASSPIATAANTFDYITVRIAYDGSNSWYVWRDGALLNPDLSTPFIGSNGSFNASGGWFIGDFAGNIAGDWSMDYLRVEPGAFAIPEPSRAILLVSGLLACLPRHRRRRTSA